MRRLAAVLAVASTAAAGCGSDTPKAGLAWSGKPAVFRSHSLPHDRVVIAHVKNVSSKTLHLVAAKLVVRDADGHRLKGSAAFTNTYGHGLFGMLQQPKHLPAAELLRLGKVVYIPAGASVPFFAAWTLTASAKEPVSIDYGSGSLTVPPATAETEG
jgi:hypothetical protein